MSSSPPRMGDDQSMSFSRSTQRELLGIVCLHAFLSSELTLTYVSRRPRTRETGTAPVRRPGRRDSRRAAIPNEPGEFKCQMGGRHIRHKAASRRVAQGSSPCRTKTIGHRRGCGKGKAGSRMLPNGPREVGHQVTNALPGLRRRSCRNSCRQSGRLQGPGARYDA